MRAIVDAAQRAEVVLLGEIHGSESLHAFFRSLVANPDARDVFDDVVVEFGNSRFQPIMDRYIEGGRVPLDEVRRAWELTTQGSVWLAPVYEAFFRSVRAHNREAQPRNRVRVLLGDPPISPRDLRDPRTTDLYATQRDPHFASVIQREVVAKGRRAIVIAGAGHVVRRPPTHPTLANLLERRSRCDTDPAAIRIGIDWCKSAKAFRPVKTHVVIPESVVATTDLIEDGWRKHAPTLIPIHATRLAAAELALEAGRGGERRQPWTIGQAADSLLLVP